MTDGTMDKRVFNIVKELTEIPGPIGYEQRVTDRLRELWSKKAEHLWETPVGNLLAHVGGSGRRVLIGGHADEICFLIRAVTDDGFLFLSIWNADREGYPPRWLFPIGQAALIVGPNEPVEGVFATATGHSLSQSAREKPRLDWNDLFVDIGASSAAEVAARGVRVGHRVIWNPPTRSVGDSRIAGKAMDDRAALAIMTVLLDRVESEKLTCDLYLTSTVMEETGLEGALSIGREQQFDEAIALDIGLTGDIPTGSLLDIPVRLGAGPIVVHQDSEIHYSRKVIESLIELAGVAGIPLQHAVYQHYASDGAAFIRQGIPTALLAFPTRYTHSPFEVVDELDLEATVRLLEAYITH